MDSEIIDQIHYQYRDEYEGYHVIGSASLYVPVYRMDCSVSFTENAPIPLMDEFICRMIQAGVTEPKMMSEFLGVDLEIIESALTSMSCNDYIYNDGNWHLSTLGAKLFREKRKLSRVTENIELHFDGLCPEFRTEFLVGDAKHKLISLRQGPNEDGVDWEHGLVMAPRTRPSEVVSDQDHLELSKAVTELLGKHNRCVAEVGGFEVLGVDLVYHEYLLLVYSNHEGAAKRKLLAYDPCGEVPGPDYRVTRLLLELHDRRELDERLLANEGVEGDARKLVMEALAAYERGPISMRIREIEASEAQTQQRLSSPEDLAHDEVEALRRKLAEIEAEKQTLRADLETQIQQFWQQNVQFIMNQEIRMKFSEALCEAKEKLDIVCPWITERVVDDDFISKFRSLLERGVQVTILYGIEAARPDTHWKTGIDQGNRERKTEELAEKLRQLGKNYPVPPRIRRSNTHEKLLICDDQFLILGSFNFLSYRGEPGPGFRNEGGLLIKEPKFIERVREMIYNR